MNNNSGWFRLNASSAHKQRTPARKVSRSRVSHKQRPLPSTKPPADPLHKKSTAAVTAPNARLSSQTLGDSGPVLAQDTVLHETLEDFISSTALERVVHTKGFGAFGYFQTTHSMRAYTKAPIFQSVGTKVPAVTRFSLAVSNKGTADTSRNVRGFATKFYTDDGIYDLLCNHIPVFLVQDGIHFPESIRSFGTSSKNNLANPNRFWQFVADFPESLHFVTWLYSDTGTIKSLRHIRGYGVNTYVWENKQGEYKYVKYHWIPKAGERTIDRTEAIRLAGEQPDVAGQDLYATIAKGEPVVYTLHVQLMDPADAEHLPYDPLDDTKVWSEKEYPLHPVGQLVLNRNPDHYQQQIEQLAFAPSNLLEGIAFSDDKMLQGRSFIYPDAQRHRLGNNFRDLPANRQEGWKPEKMVSSGNGRKIKGTIARSHDPKQDFFTQAGDRYQSLSETQQQHLAANIAADLAAASKNLQKTILDYLHHASPTLSKQVKEGMQG